LNTLLLQVDERGTIIPVRAQAGARKNAVLGERQGSLRVAVTAAPEKGKANKAIVELLSAALDAPKSAIELISGETSPQKRFLITGASADEVQVRLAASNRQP